MFERVAAVEGSSRAWQFEGCGGNGLVSAHGAIVVVRVGAAAGLVVPGRRAGVLCSFGHSQTRAGHHFPPTSAVLR